MTTQFYCLKCNRPTEDGICVVHGEVVTYLSPYRDGLHEILSWVIEEIEKEQYGRGEIKSIAVDRIEECVLGHYKEGEQYDQ